VARDQGDQGDGNATTGFKRFRKRLEDNKIFFETLAALFVAVAAVVVGILADRIYARQADLLAVQTQLMRIDHMARIRASRGLTYDPRTHKYATEYMDITNSGAPVSNFHVTEYSFFSVETFISDTARIDYLVPVGNYFDADTETDSPTGQLAHFYSEQQNNIKAFDAGNYLTEEANKLTKRTDKVQDYAFTHVIKFIRNTYTNALGENVEEYGCIGGINYVNISNNIGSDTFQYFTASIATPTWLDMTTMNEKGLSTALYKAWKVGAFNNSLHQTPKQCE